MGDSADSKTIMKNDAWTYFHKVSSVLSKVDFNRCVVAGSFPMWTYLLTHCKMSAWKWRPSDIDIFVFGSEGNATPDEFKEIVDNFKAKFTPGFIVKERTFAKGRITDMMVKVNGTHFNLSFINAWRPRDSFLEGFDFTVCQVYMDSSALLPTPLNDSVKIDLDHMRMGVRRDMNIRSRAAARTKARMMKYLSRGFSIYQCSVKLDEVEDEEFSIRYQLSTDEYVRWSSYYLRLHAAREKIETNALIPASHTVNQEGEIVNVFRKR